MHAWDFLQSSLLSLQSWSQFLQIPFLRHIPTNTPLWPPRKILMLLLCTMSLIWPSRLVERVLQGRTGYPCRGLQICYPLRASCSAYLLSSPVTDVCILAFTTNTLPSPESVCLVNPIHKKLIMAMHLNGQIPFHCGGVTYSLACTPTC